MGMGSVGMGMAGMGVRVLAGGGRNESLAGAAEKLTDATTGYRYFADGPAISQSPNCVCTFRYFGVQPGDNVPARGPAPPDHGVQVVAAGSPGRREVDLTAEA